jgi:hypothetical protein
MRPTPAKSAFARPRAHSKRAAPRSPEAPPSEPDPLGDLSLQGRGEPCLNWVAPARLQIIPGPRDRKVRVTLSHSTPEPPARLRSGHPVRRASVPLGKFRIAPIEAAHKRPPRRCCERNPAWSVDGLWRTPGELEKPGKHQGARLILRCLPPRAGEEISQRWRPWARGVPRPRGHGRRRAPERVRPASASGRPRRTPRAASP